MVLCSYYEGTIEDITERRKGDQSLHESEERYRILAEASHDMIFIINRKGMVEYTNTTAAAQFGLTSESLFGKMVTDIFPPKGTNRQKENIQKVIRSGEPLYIEVIDNLPGTTNSGSAPGWCRSRTKPAEFIR